MTPRDVLGNHYMVNFIDLRTKHCRVFIAKTNDIAAHNFKHLYGLFSVSLTVGFMC